jgi:hypothetical protein
MIPVKRALGLFHFNVQYVAGNAPGYHRYCEHAIRPFLDTVEANPNWRVSFESAGRGLMFLNEHYPSTMRKLRRLIEQGQLELISSTYAPALWVAFPKRDLVRSIEINRQCLQQLGLPASRIFFAQEAFFGTGLRHLEDFFDVVLCKDDYLDHFCGADKLAPAYRLGKMLVIAGSNHLRNELVRRTQSGETALPTFTEINRWRIEQRKISVSDGCPAICRPALGDTEWFWYHFGSGHHMATWAAPGDWNNFFADRQWLRMTADLVCAYAADGYRFSTLSEFATAVDREDLTDLPAVVEGGWNSERSLGVYCWMGRHANSWEDDAGVLALAWRSRKALVECERVVSELKDPELRSTITKEIETVWQRQIMAESSDSTGWAPTSSEVQFAKGFAEEVLRNLSSIREKLGRLWPADHRWNGESEIAAYRLAPPECAPFCPAKLFGGEGYISVVEMRENLQLVDVYFTAKDSACGIRFETFQNQVTYCPSADEQEPVRLSLSDLKPSKIYLPLANGLISTGESAFLIRDNANGQVAACIDKEDSSLSFAVEGISTGRPCRWRFLLFRGNLDDAVKLANEFNCT